MTTVRATTWSCLVMLISSGTLTVIGLLLLALNLRHPDVHVFDYWIEDTVISVVFPIVGAVIVARRPGNVIGWIFCALGLSVGLDHLVAEYAIYALLTKSASLAGGEAAAWVRSWIWVFYLGLFVFLGLLFPNGRLPSPRWRPFAWLSVSTVVAGAVMVAFSPGPVDGLGPIRNPLGVPGEANLVWLVNWMVLVPTVVAAVSLLLRLRHAAGEERQQLKWFAYAAILASVGAVLTYPIADATGSLGVRWGGFVIFMIGIVGLPISVAIAILRHRLYDIDLIINRTLVYSMLTASLALVYVCCVVSLQYLLRLLTGEGSQIAIVASTLTIAALFNPFRHRVQIFVDRRFYRERYDAAQVLGAFGARLRNETNLDQLNSELLATVKETMQPKHVSLWLRQPAGSPERSDEHEVRT